MIKIFAACLLTLSLFRGAAYARYNCTVTYSACKVITRNGGTCTPTPASACNPSSCNLSACNQVTKTVIKTGPKCEPSTNPQYCSGTCTPAVSGDACNPSSCNPPCQNTECVATCNSNQYIDKNNNCQPMQQTSGTDFDACMKCAGKAELVDCLMNNKKC